MDRNVLASELRRLFFAKKTELLGKKYKPDKRMYNDVYWLKAAEICEREQIDPTTFVEVLFGESSNPLNLRPNMIYGTWAIGVVREYKKRIDTIVRTVNPARQPEETSQEEIYDHNNAAYYNLQFEVQLALMLLENKTGEKGIGKRQEYWLAQPFFGMSPYLRILLAPLNFEIRERFLNEARKALRTRPELFSAMRRLCKRYDQDVDVLFELNEQQPSPYV